MVLNHFDQFEMMSMMPFHPFGNLDISITNSTIFMATAVGSMYALSKFEKGYMVPTSWQSVLEMVYETMHNMMKENIGTTSDKTSFFPMVLVMFLFLALMNMFGLVPYTFTPTSHMVVTFGLSLSMFMACTMIGFNTYKLDFFAMFMPAGAPLWLAPFLVMIEFISHGAKAISLGVRLAANITAGHLLFAMLSGFTWNMMTAGGLITIVSMFPLFMVLFITVLEMAVALMQAYVFCLLTTMYINDSVNLH